LEFPDIYRDPDLFNNIIGTINCLWEGHLAPIIAAGSRSHSCEAKFYSFLEEQKYNNFYEVKIMKKQLFIEAIKNGF